MKRNKSFTSNEPLLYLIASPIGNLSEFTPRAIEIISSCDYIAAEDTRNTFSLLKHFNITKPLISLHEHNEIQNSELVINKIKEGKKVAYLSDAGYPGISDPGNILVKLCLENNINVSTISGSSAFINALVASGLSSSHFYFYGFLSSKDSEAKSELNSLKYFDNTIIFYEAPHRIIRTLNLILEIFGDREVTLARELTKLNEEYIRGKLSELISLPEDTLKGEMVLIVNGYNDTKDIDEEILLEKINSLLKLGISKKQTVEIISTLFNINKNTIYKLVK